MIKEIQKVSEITADILAAYLRISEPDKNELKEISTFLNISKEYITGYTGVKDLDKHVDFIDVVFVLVQDMYDNRTFYINENNINKTVSSILNLYAENLL